MVKNPPANLGDSGHTGMVHASGGSPGGGNGNPLQYSWLKNSMARGAWQALLHEITESDMTKQLSTHTDYFMPKLSHSYVTTGKTTAWLYGYLLVK